MPSSNGERIVVYPDTNRGVIDMVAEMVRTMHLVGRLTLADNPSPNAPTETVNFSLQSIHFAHPNGTPHPLEANPEEKRPHITGRIINNDGSESHRIVSLIPDHLQPEQQAGATVTPSALDEEYTPEPFDGSRIHC